MANFVTSYVLILVSIFFISITPSLAGHKLTDKEIKNLCSKTGNLGGCYKLLKSDRRTANADAKALAEISVDLASEKANKIHSQLNSFAKATHDSRLRDIYTSCSKNYNDAIRDLEVVKNNLKSNAYKNVAVQIKDAFAEIKSCEKIIGGRASDRAHIKKISKGFEFLLNIVKVTSENLNKK